MTVTGTPLLQLNTGEYAVYAGTVFGGSGTNTLTFDYVVQNGDNASYLDYNGANLLLNGGTKNYGCKRH